MFFFCLTCKFRKNKNFINSFEKRKKIKLKIHAIFRGNFQLSNNINCAFWKGEYVVWWSSARTGGLFLPHTIRTRGWSRRQRSRRLSENQVLPKLKMRVRTARFGRGVWLRTTFSRHKFMLRRAKIGWWRNFLANLGRVDTMERKLRHFWFLSSFSGSEVEGSFGLAVFDWRIVGWNAFFWHCLLG